MRQARGAAARGAEVEGWGALALVMVVEMFLNI